MKPIDFTPVYFNTHPLLLLLLILIICSAKTWAEPVEPDTGPKNTALEITKDTLGAKIEAVSSQSGLDEVTKSKVLSIYQAAQDNLSNIVSLKARTIDFNQALKQAPEKTKKLQKEIELTLLEASKQKPEDFTNIPSGELDQRLILENAKISLLDEKIQKLENELVLQQARVQLIREETVSAKQDLESIQKKLAVPDDITGSKFEAEASQLYLKSLFDSRMTALKMLDVEAISNPARLELLKTEFRLSGIQKNALIPVVSTIENQLTERQRQEAKDMQDALNQAEKELSGKHPLIQVMTRENMQYSLDLQAITTKIENYTEQKTKIDTQAIAIDSDFKSAEKKISLAGLSPVLGKILREERSNLVTQDQFSLQSETIQNETALTSLEQYKIEDKLKKFTDIDSELKEMMQQKP